ncbi:hypothetical protein HMPREF3216_00553 [Gardnerella vaginalis]|uniref:Uncharacterized protein n=1 Tax=Gardnerella vaginalis TaxID=2702 RepID=A0A133NQ30_GARVA|nr:hypothetical protein HMPREF3216_00553 [Gardnerella vaginalis]
MSYKTRQIVRALQRAHVFAAQKQCFCLERLSAPNYLRALRFKREGRSSRLLLFPKTPNT